MPSPRSHPSQCENDEPYEAPPLKVGGDGTNRGALNPIIRPEQGLPPILDRDRDGSLKETFHLCLMTKLEAGPSSLRVCSSKPEPAHPEHHDHQLKVGNAKASQLLGGNTC
jgi:hypothetical protein